MSELSKYLKEYREGKSILEIAKENNTYPNKIRRMFIKAGEILRDKGEAQKLALSRGTAKHPTAGTKRSLETKSKISDKVANAWKNMSEEQAKQRKETMAEIWKNKPQSEKDEMCKKAAQAVAKAGKEGSKAEQYVGNELRKLGYNIIIHKKALVANTNLELDIFIPEERLVIEIDGPAHFLPIWGEEALAKRVALDNEKNGLLLGEGYSIIRVKCLVKNMTNKRQKILFNLILETLKTFNGKRNYFHEIELA
jgi:very-short-patch-repair endonuclease